MSPQAGADASPTSDPKHFCDCGTASLPSLPSLFSPCWAWSTICHSGGDFILRHKTSHTVWCKCHRCGKCYVNVWGRHTVIMCMSMTFILCFSFVLFMEIVHHHLSFLVHFNTHSPLFLFKWLFVSALSSWLILSSKLMFPCMCLIIIQGLTPGLHIC